MEDGGGLILKNVKKYDVCNPYYHFQHECASDLEYFNTALVWGYRAVSLGFSKVAYLFVDASAVLCVVFYFLNKSECVPVRSKNSSLLVFL